MYIFLFLIYFLLVATYFMYVTCICLYYSYIWKKRNIGSIYFRHMFNTQLFKSKQTSTKVAPGLAFSKNFKNYYVFGFFENLALFLFWFKTGNKKECRFQIFLVFGAAKSMNSRNLVQGRWYKTNTLPDSTWKWSVK